MSDTVQAETAYRYTAITALTGKRLNELLQQAKAAPEDAKKLLNLFSGTFQLWFDITQADPPPQQDKDGPRFLDLIPQFPETAFAPDADRLKSVLALLGYDPAPSRHHRHALLSALREFATLQEDTALEDACRAMQRDSEAGGEPDSAAAAMTFEDARATLMANAAIPGDHAGLTSWDALRAAADAELVQAAYHMGQLEDVIRSAEVQ